MRRSESTLPEVIRELSRAAMRVSLEEVSRAFGRRRALSRDTKAMAHSTPMTPRLSTVMDSP